MLDHRSVGRNTHIDIRRMNSPNEAEKADCRIIEDYIGQQNINMSLNMGDWIMKQDDDRGWLDCCSSERYNITNN